MQAIRFNNNIRHSPYICIIMSIRASVRLMVVIFYFLITTLK